MTIEELLKRVREIEGIEQAEYCAMNAKRLMAYIYRANGDQRYGGAVPCDVKDGAPFIEQADGDNFVTAVRSSLKSDGKDD